MKKILLSVFLLFTLNSHAGSVCTNCEVLGIQPDVRRDGTYIWLKGGDWSASSSACATPSTKAFFIPRGSNLENTMISVAMTAYVAKKTIGYIYGTGECTSTTANYETIDYFYVRD